MTVRHFLHDDDITPDEQAIVLGAAERLASDPRAAAGALSGDAIGLFFEKPSLRTRVSSEVGAADIGALAVQLRAEELQLVRGETPEDSARVLAGYVALLMARVNSHDLLERFAAPAVLPIVNALSDESHPLQALADLLTLRQEWGSVAGRHLVYVGDGNNVACSLLVAGAMAGLRVTVACPSGFAPPAAVVERAGAFGEVDVVEDVRAAVTGADALYTDVWVSMGDEGEEERRRAALGPYQLDAAKLALSAPDAVVLHCLPAHRGEEVTADVLDGPSARIWRQAHNRRAATAALFLYLLRPEVALALARP